MGRESELAIHGGPSVRRGRPWPKWPSFSERTEHALHDALASGRWTVSWYSDGRDSYERRFAASFAEYTGAGFAVGVDHGSSALVVALEALDVGAGDEVIVPAVTWVATASAVLRVGALPVFADVDPATGCIDVASVAELLSSATRAIIAVHLGATIADIDGLLDISERCGVPLIEDCAQAHGAVYRGRHVGTFGALGAFSFQTGKVLASGEGGAVVTSDPVMYRRLQALRADSRCYRTGQMEPGSMELVETGEVMGGNYTMSEFHAAILLERLAELDAQHRRRHELAGVLEGALAGARDRYGPVPNPSGLERRSVYEYGINIRDGAFGNAPVGAVAKALAAELERPVYPPDRPLVSSHLFRPETKRRFSQTWTEAGRRRSLDRSYPGASRYVASTVLLHHSAFLGDPSDMDDIAGALAKVWAHSAELSMDDALHAAAT